MKTALAIALATLAIGSAQADNVALNGVVSTTGADFGNSAGWCCGAPAALSSVTDGTFLTNGQQWNEGTVFWSGALGADTINIDLLHPATVTSLILQADNNDDYQIQYRDTSNAWHDLVVISPNRSWGLDVGNATLATPVLANGFRISAAGGDGDYAVAEFQAQGTVVAVPEPETYAMLAAGLALIGVAARRRKGRSA